MAFHALIWFIDTALRKRSIVVYFAPHSIAEIAQQLIVTTESLKEAPPDHQL
jgi:hypothetical protein